MTYSILHFNVRLKDGYFVSVRIGSEDMLLTGLN